MRCPRLLLCLLVLIVPAWSVLGQERSPNSLRSLRTTMSMIAAGHQGDLLKPSRAVKKPGTDAKRMTDCNIYTEPCDICLCGCDEQSGICLEECRENGGHQCDYICGNEWENCYLSCFSSACS